MNTRGFTFVLLFGLVVTSVAGQALAQTPETDTGINRPVSAQELDRLRRTINDETRSSIEGIAGFHSESGDLNNRLNYYRYGGRINWKLSSGPILYFGGVRTPYSNDGSIAEATGTSATLGVKAPLSDRLTTQAEVGGTRFSNDGGITINGLASVILSTTSLSLDFTASRTNVEESMLSAVGIRPVGGPFARETVGRVMDNRFVARGTYRVMERLDVFGNGGFGYRKGENVDSNSFALGGGGVGYTLVAAPPDSGISLLRASYELNTIGFEQNRLGFGGASLMDARGRAIAPNRIGLDGISPVPSGTRAGIGGYFSPDNYLVHFIRGEVRGQPAPALAYELSAFIGSQYYTGTSRRQAGGVSGTVSVRLTDRFSVPFTAVIDNYGPFTQRTLFARLIARF